MHQLVGVLGCKKRELTKAHERNIADYQRVSNAQIEESLNQL